MLRDTNLCFKRLLNVSFAVAGGGAKYGERTCLCLCLSKQCKSPLANNDNGVI